VLEPLSGYLWLAARLSGPGSDRLCEAFNFGPRIEANRTVAELVTEILKHRPGRWEDRSNPNAPHEASLLNLSIEKAFHLLGWRPVWNFEQTVARTTEWYTRVEQSAQPPGALTDSQIAVYTADAAAAGLAWAGT
jgi:CDP-glucose 4,6-dehydratase